MRQSATSPAPQLPPEIVRYLRGAPPEARQFDFLIGHWHVAATAFGPDGVVQRKYAARWEAQHLNGGRMVMDDFRAQSPQGEDLSSFVTLRTWCESTSRWEITGQAALQPALNVQWHGQWQDGEMRLHAVGVDPQGVTVHTRIRFFDIAPENFTWESQFSRDGGDTWHLSARLQAQRIAAANVNLAH
ncbi:hypothetical protein [Ottowia testudinis]|uniref:DUF1579 domain-containing protein n=1 Tax=Ottowia testudinis TaxID=2816950 RepID=A0A975CH32_9BURK|nr:hypothetical protein [Ottowia testudinis]QTD46265.1 hypothetical protein J1M35_05015 [Ottowia testudinis]